MEKSVTVDSNVLENIITNVTSDKESLDEVKTSLENDFTVFSEIGLFESCLNGLKEEVGIIDTAYEVLITELKNHVDDYNELERQLSNVADNYQSYYSPTTGGGGYDYQGGNDTVDVIPDTTPIDPEKMDKKVEDLDINAINTMINFISIIKDNNKKLSDIIFDETNSNYFCEILQKFYLTYGSTKVEYDDASGIQKAFIKKILNSEIDLPKELLNDSILKYKEYLVNVAKDNKIEVYDLIFNDKYKNLVKTSLDKLYNREIDENLYDSEFCSNFAEFIDKKVKSENVTKEELFDDVKKLL